MQQKNEYIINLLVLISTTKITLINTSPVIIAVVTKLQKASTMTIKWTYTETGARGVP